MSTMKAAATMETAATIANLDDADSHDDGQC